MQPNRAILASRSIKQSMSHRSNYFDNTVIVSFFGTLKAEYFYIAAPNSIYALEVGMDDYVNDYKHE